MRIKVLILAMLATIAVPVFSSCGSGGADPVAEPSPETSVTAGGTVSPGVPAKPSANPLGQRPSSPGPPGRSPCLPTQYYSGTAGVPGRNYIRVVTRGQTRWGPGCEVLNPGDRCDVMWQGGFSLQTGEKAYLLFQAWVKGQSKPYKETYAGPFPYEQQLKNVAFPVTIPKAEEIAFRVVLLNDAKQPVAISDSWSYRINCTTAGR